jgi:hypothetical protein
MTGRFLALALASALALPALAQEGGLRVFDAFGRDVTARGVTLLDWEGYIANPAVKLTVRFPADAKLPGDLHISGTDPRLHFDRSDGEDRHGIGKRIRVAAQAESVDFHVAIFPDRDGVSERHQLMLQLFTGGVEQTRLMLPVYVIDQDRPDRPIDFPLHLDFSEDQTGYFSDPHVRRVMVDAARDWAYFLADPGYDTVPAGSEVIHLWGPDGFRVTRPVTIPRSYRGYYMYVSGIRHDEMRAGGAPSRTGGFHTVHGEEHPLRRSGSVEFEVRGNWNLLGWLLTHTDNDWWVSGSLRSEQADLYSIGIHEMGHALAFHGAYPVWGEAKKDWVFRDPVVTAYLGQEPKIDTSDHLVGVIDPLSLYGSFGVEYHARMKARRWLLTKSHLLFLQAIGYRLRHTTALETLSVAEPKVELRAREARFFSASLPIVGGVPTYRVTITDGALPEGVRVDSFTGEISGRPWQSGSFEATLQVEDQDPTTKPATIRVAVQVTP